MEAIGLFFTKFSDELLSAQIAVLSFAVALGIYWMLIRRKKRETAEWVPAALVRAYMDRMRSDEHETRVRLFGEDFGHAPGPVGDVTQALSAGAGQVRTVVTQDPALVKEVDALRAQLSSADGRAMEFDRTMNGLRAEKASLDQKLKDALAAASAAPAAGAAANPAATKELEELREKLKEYEVIEDDLANLKKFQKENEQLKARISALEGGAPAAAAPAPAPVAAAPAPVSAAPAPAPAPVAVAPAPAPAPVAEANTNVLAPVTPTVDAAAPAADGKSSKQKEEELLSEFEKMLAS